MILGAKRRSTGRENDVHARLQAGAGALAHSPPSPAPSPAPGTQSPPCPYPVTCNRPRPAPLRDCSAAALTRRCGAELRRHVARLQAVAPVRAARGTKRSPRPRTLARPNPYSLRNHWPTRPHNRRSADRRRSPRVSPLRRPRKRPDRVRASFDFSPGPRRRRREPLWGSRLRGQSDRPGSNA